MRGQRHRIKGIIMRAEGKEKKKIPCGPVSVGWSNRDAPKKGITDHDQKVINRSAARLQDLSMGWARIHFSEGYK